MVFDDSLLCAVRFHTFTMFKKLMVIGLISAYLLYTPVPKDWDPSLLKFGIVFKIINGVVNLVVSDTIQSQSVR